MLCHLLGTLEANLQVLDRSSDKQTLHKDTALHSYKPSWTFFKQDCFASRSVLSFSSEGYFSLATCGVCWQQFCSFFVGCRGFI